MTAKTENAAREMTATGRSDGGSPRPAGSASEGSPATRQMAMYGIAAYALARLAQDRRFQTSVIMWILGLAVAKGAVKTGTKNLIVGTERYYLHVKPGWLHRRRRRRQRRAAKKRLRSP